MIKDENTIAKCLSISEYKKRENSDPKDTFIFSPLFSDFNKTGALAPGDQKSRFQAIVGDPCLHGRSDFILILI